MEDWRDLVRQGKFAEAEEAMLAETGIRTGYGDELITRAGFYEDWGDRALDKTEARKFYEKSLEDFRVFAACATSGGEGNARMIDVRRVEKKIANLNDAD